MGNRLTRIYTRTGDQGSTGLSDGSRIDKDHPRIEAIGDIDELNSVLGLLLSHDLPKDIRHSLSEIQQTLFDIGGELSMPEACTLGSEPVIQLEQQLEMYNAILTPLREFILPGSTEASARCHLARAVCRRAERRVVALGRTERVNEHVLAYLNRLSDLLFVLSRVLTRLVNGREIYWRSPKLRG
ncbi:MAG: cob(I)yrinic acid a,c-diamide adenosyltransferase [Chromatiales bacterium]|jgi:cob(I)alamin adenosyltransferase|nr:cob(I)yrinic acid a,c-diamide adenosyltransferase [Chromatiales bacterium]